MANKFLGVGVNFGVSSAGVSGTGVGTFKMQDIERANKASVDDVADGDGRRVQRTVYDEIEEATLEYVVSASTTAGAVTATTLPLIGALITITDSNDSELAGTNWIVADASIKRSNKGAARVTLKLEAIPGITAVTS